MTTIPDNTIRHVRQRLRQATKPYRSLMEDTNPVIEHVLTALASVDAIQNNDVNPSFLHRVACEQLFTRLRDVRDMTSDVEAPFHPLSDDQCLASFLAAMGYNEKDASELLGWSPRKYKNLLRSAEMELNVAHANQWTSNQLRFAIEHAPRAASCPSTLHIWSCAHGDLEPEEVIPTALHTAHCGRCSELWLLAWGIDPQLQRGPFLTRSDTEDMRDYNEPITMNTQRSPQEYTGEPEPKARWIGPILVRAVVVFLVLSLFVYLLG